MSDLIDATSPPAEQEVWRDIPSMMDAYQASSFGRVRSLPRATTAGLVLKQAQNRQGYFIVTPCLSGVIKTRLVSQLVCEAFHGFKPEDKDLAAHGDGNHQNNSSHNLRWATYLENEEDKRAHGRVATGERNPSSKLTQSQVQEIIASPENGVTIAKAYGISTSLVSQIRRGQVWNDDGNLARRTKRRSKRASCAPRASSKIQASEESAETPGSAQSSGG